MFSTGCAPVPMPRRREEAAAAQPRLQRREDQGLAAEARRLGDLQQLLRREGEDGAEGLAEEFVDVIIIDHSSNM